MTAHNDRREQLERLMQRTLSELPLRQAPPSLERRVIEAIEGRASQMVADTVSTFGRSFHRRGFASWTLVTRAALIACCLASAILVAVGLKELASGIARLPADPGIAGRLNALREAAEAAAALGALFVRLVRMIPPAWLLSALLATALVYAMLFGLVAIGYSTLYTTPERSRS